MNINIALFETDNNKKAIEDIIQSLDFAAKKVLFPTFRTTIKKINLEQALHITNNINDYYLLILDSSINQNEVVKENLNGIETALLSDKQVLNKSLRFSKLLLEPNDIIEQPETLKKLIAYEFFDFPGRGRNAKPFESSSEDTKLWSVVLDLVYDIKDTTLLKEEKAVHNFAYLGSYVQEQKQYWLDIKRELLYYGYKVLPVFNYNDQSESTQEIIKKELESCQLIIQAVGGKYENVRRGEKYSFAEFENSIIREHIASNPNKQRYIWIPGDMEIKESRQQLFINRLKKDDSSDNSFIIEANLEEFKALLATKFTVASNNFNKAEPDNRQNTYYIVSNNVEYSKIVKDIIGKMSNVSFFETDEKSGHFYTEHLNNLRKTDNLIVIADNNQVWLDTKLGDVIKAIGMGKNSPFKNMVLLYAGSMLTEKYKPWLHALEIIAIENNQPDEKQLLQILSK